MSDDPNAIEAVDASLVSTRSVELVVMLLLLAAAVFLGWDNWRIGAGWAPDGPQAGYFPFWLSVLLWAAPACGACSPRCATRSLKEEVFVGRSGLRPGAAGVHPDAGVRRAGEAARHLSGELRLRRCLHDLHRQACRVEVAADRADLRRADVLHLRHRVQRDLAEAVRSKRPSASEEARRWKLSSRCSTGSRSSSPSTISG